MSKSVVGVSTPPALFKTTGLSAWSRGPPRSNNAISSNVPSSGNSAPAMGDVDGKTGVASPLTPGSVSTTSPTIIDNATAINPSATEPVSPGNLLTPDESTANANSSASPTTSSSTTPIPSMEPPLRPRRNPLRRGSSSGSNIEPMKSQTAAGSEGSDGSSSPIAGNASSSVPTTWASFLSQAKTHPPVSPNLATPNPEMKRTRSNRSRRRGSSTDPIKLDTTSTISSVPQSTTGFTLPPVPFTLPPLPSHPPPLPPVPLGPPPVPPTSVTTAKTSKLQADAAPFIPPTLLSTRKSSAIVIKNSKGQEVDLRQLSTAVPPTPIIAGVATSDPSIFLPPTSSAVKMESEDERRKRLETDTLHIQIQDPIPQDSDVSADIFSPSTTQEFTDVAPQSTDSAIDGEESEEEDDDWATKKVDVPTLATSPPTAPLDGTFPSMSAFPSSPSATSIQAIGPPPAPLTRPRRERSRRGSKRGASANRPDAAAMAGSNAPNELSDMTRTRSQGHGMTRTRSGAGNSRIPGDGNAVIRTRSSGPIARANESATLGSGGNAVGGLTRTRSGEPRRRPTPGRLDLSGLPKPGGLSSETMATALFNARFAKLRETEYPEGIERPREANADLVYNRDFLLQFRGYCTERPRGMEEHEEVTLAQPIEPPPQPTRTRSRRRRSTRTDVEPQSGFPLPSATLTVPQSAVFTGSPAADEPVFVGTIPATPLSVTIPSLSSPSMNLGRTSSRGGRARNGSNAVKLAPLGSTGTSNLPPMTRSVSHGSTRAVPSSATSTGLVSLTLLSPMDRRSRSQKSRKRSASTRNEPPSPLNSVLGDDLKPLEVSANRWMPSSASILKPSSSFLGMPDGKDVDQVSQELVEKKVKGLLNKLTLEKFDSISDQIISWADKSGSETDGQTLQLIIRLVFDKATDEAAWSAMYASLCKKMMERVSPRIADEGVKDKHGQPVVGGQLFRVYLLSRCQADFERGWSTRETLEEQQYAAVAAAKEAHGLAPGEVVFSDEYYALQKAKRRGLGLVKFIGELFKLNMLTERIMHRCILKLLDEPAEDDIESICQLLKTVGAALGGAKGKESMDMYFGRMRELSQDASISQRIRFMLMDVIDLRSRNWISKTQVAAPMTLAAVHEAAEKEASEKNSSSSRPIPIARNTSRRGQNRSEASASKEEAWGSTGASRSFSRGLGVSLSSTLSSTPRTEEFAKSPSIRSPASVGPIHSLARLTSEPGSSRMTRQPSEPGKSRSRRGGQDKQINRRTSVDFEQLDAAVESGSSRRKRLQLLPRSVGVAVAGSAEDPPIEMRSSLISTDQDPPFMSEDQAKAKIEEDMKEFLQIRDLDEAVGYFEALPSDHRHLLVDKFVSKMDSKESDIALIAELFSRLSSADICSGQTFEQGFAPTVEALDDISLDVPSVYSVMGKLLTASRLPRDTVDQLAGTINVYGQVLLHPRDKLMKAYDSAA